jgi:hypothetical protein
MNILWLVLMLIYPSSNAPNPAFERDSPEVGYHSI